MAAYDAVAGLLMALSALQLNAKDALGTEEGVHKVQGLIDDFDPNDRPDVIAVMEACPEGREQLLPDFKGWAATRGYAVYHDRYDDPEPGKLDRHVLVVLAAGHL